MYMYIRYTYSASQSYDLISHYPKINKKEKIKDPKIKNKARIKGLD